MMMFGNKLYKEVIKRETDAGTRVTYAYTHIALHREFYFVKKIEQKVEGWFRIKFWVPVKLQVFKVPTSVLPLLGQFAESEDSDVDTVFLQDYVRDTQVEIDEQYDIAYKSTVDVYGDADNAVSNAIKASIKNYRDTMRALWSNFTDKELEILKSFIDGGYFPLCREQYGSTIRYYLVGLFKNALVFSAVEVISNKLGSFLYDHEQFPVMRDYAQALVNASEKGEVANDKRSK